MASLLSLGLNTFDSISFVLEVLLIGVPLPEAGDCDLGVCMKVVPSFCTRSKPLVIFVVFPPVGITFMLGVSVSGSIVFCLFFDKEE